MNKVYKIGYNIVNGYRCYDRISAPDMESAERQWKHDHRDLNYTGFTIYNPDYYRQENET